MFSWLLEFHKKYIYFQFYSFILIPRYMSTAFFMPTCWKWLSNSCSWQLGFLTTLYRLGQFGIDRSTVKCSLLSTPLSKWPVHWIHPYSSMDLKIHENVRETREEKCLINWLVWLHTHNKQTNKTNPLLFRTVHVRPKYLHGLCEMLF